MVDETRESVNPPHVAVTSRSHWSAGLIWLVPIVAALIGVGMVVRNWAAEGPAIEISFSTAEGLEAGKTQVKYKDVVIGLVKSIRLDPDHTHVVVGVHLDKDASVFATADSRFWVVRPRFGTSGVSGIGTLLSGAYIGADAGGSQEVRKNFIGMERPPAVIHGAPGKRFVLNASDIGSLDVGSPVYYRRIQVGRVVDYNLDQQGNQLRVDIFVDAPYDRFVTTAARFWNASGVDLNLDAGGLKLSTQSLATVIAGGIAFAPKPGQRDVTPASEGATFTLFDDLQTAMAPPDGEPEYLRMRFSQSLRGLSVNSPVEFRGVELGKVVSIDVDYDPDTHSFPIVVGAVVYPQRLGRANEKIVRLEQSDADPATRLANFIKPLIEHGLRAQARVGNLLTGQLYISLDFVPGAAKADFDLDARPIELPTSPGSFDHLQEQMTDIVDKIDKIPFADIGKHLDSAISELDRTLHQINASTLPQVNATLAGAQGTLGSARQAIAADSPLQQNLTQALNEMERAARSLRVLTDYLGVHPETLLRGKPADPAPHPAPTTDDSRNPR